jgi:hypothetical protein
MRNLQMKMMIIPKESTTLGCHKLFLPKNCTMNEGANHPQLAMLVGFLLVDRLYLPTKVVANLSAVVVIGLQEVVVMVFQKVVVMDP